MKGLAIWARVAAALVVVMLAVGCDRQPAPSSGTAEGQARPWPLTASSEAVTIDFSSDPEPRKSGSNMIEVTVMRPGGAPITDAAVSVVFSKPASRR